MVLNKIFLISVILVLLIFSGIWFLTTIHRTELVVQGDSCMEPLNDPLPTKPKGLRAMTGREVDGIHYAWMARLKSDGSPVIVYADGTPSIEFFNCRVRGRIKI